MFHPLPSPTPSRGRLGFALLALAVALTGCAPTSSPATPGGATTDQRSQAPKVLTVGLLRQPSTIEGFTGEGEPRAALGSRGRSSTITLR